MPSAWVNSTISGVCQSVMKPGCTSVCTAAARSRSGADAVMPSSSTSTWAPILIKVVMAVTSRSWAQPTTRTWPPVSSPATR